MNYYQTQDSSSISTYISKKIRLKSFNSDYWHAISLLDKTCDCEQFQAEGRCGHLYALGIYRIRLFRPTTHPTFSQALSALVKSLRIRRVKEAVYWLVYLDTFEEKPYRFRTARRILIGSAEDGHSIPVMEEIVRNFRWNSKTGTPLIHLIADVIRICKLPNWWHIDSWGIDYIYHSLVGERQWMYKRWDHRLITLQNEIKSAIKTQDRATVLGGVTEFNNLPERFGATKQAEFLLSIARKNRHYLAARLCEVHLSAKTALSGDNNFLCQAAWMLAGGVSPVANSIEPVTNRECYEMLEQAQKRWQNPKPIPRWCVDGLHSAGDDPRFAGLLPQMYAVCRAYQYYGRINPADKWLPEFQCFDGLIIDQGNEPGEDR